MSPVTTNNSSESSTPRGGQSTASTPPQSGGGVSVGVYEELERLVQFMPQRYREVFCFRWGLGGAFAHIQKHVARKFEVPGSTVISMLDRCLWNVARHAHTFELPALHAMLGEDRERWAERAWGQAEQRWGNQESAFAETVLWLSVAGVDVPVAQWMARQHMIELGLGRDNKWRRPRTAQELRAAVDQMLAHVIWPADPATLSDLHAFGVRRPLLAWAPPRSGVFNSDKLGRLVGFDSELELAVLRQLDADPRVVDYCEQPVTIPYILDGQAHEYTPDVIVRLTDGRAFIIEAKPIEGLGDFTNWMKWASLARWCAQAGLGFWIGSPQRSILDHQGIQPDPECHALITDEVHAGAVSDEHYLALKSLVGGEQLALSATAELLQWRADKQRIQQAEGLDSEEAQRFWALIDQHRPAQALAAALAERA